LRKISVLSQAGDLKIEECAQKPLLKLDIAKLSQDFLHLDDLGLVWSFTLRHESAQAVGGSFPLRRRPLHARPSGALNQWLAANRISEAGCRRAPAVR
jgi:hypothetical protein